MKFIFERSHLSKTLDMVVCACHSYCNEKPKIGGSWSRPAWTRKQDPISKTTRAKKGWRHDMARLEHLPSKLEVLNSNITTTKKVKIKCICISVI
jgi:hypothetical protein